MRTVQRMVRKEERMQRGARKNTQESECECELHKEQDDFH